MNQKPQALSIMFTLPMALWFGCWTTNWTITSSNHYTAPQSNLEALVTKFITLIFKKIKNWFSTFLLSSSTVFMFSIQTASTGPSNNIHFLSSLCETACSRKDTASTPSDHSWETGSKLPYSWPIVIDFGLIILYFTYMMNSKKIAHWVNLLHSNQRLLVQTPMGSGINFVTHPRQEAVRIQQIEIVLMQWWRLNERGCLFNSCPWLTLV